MIIEFFGLSNSGKSVFKKEIASKGYAVSLTEKENYARKLILFLNYLFLNPASTIYLFYCLNSNFLKVKNLSFFKQIRIFLMRNSYLALVLAKYSQANQKKERIFIDEFSFQSLFMIFQKKSKEEEIANVIKRLPRSDFIFLFEGNKSLRYRAYSTPHPFKKGATLLPGSWIDKAYAKEWMKTMEHNFRVAKEIILENYIEDKSTFSKMKFSYPKVYKRKSAL